MKLNLLFSLLFIAIFSTFAFSQSITVTSKKTTYKRPNPIADHKKSFTVNYPSVKAATPALSRKIENAINYEKVMDINVEEEKTEIQWLETADYTVDYNKNGILGVSLMVEGSGAYPSTYIKTVVINTQTGNVIKAADIFTNLNGLAANLKKKQTAEIAAVKKEIKADSENSDLNPDELFEGKNYAIENLDQFSIDDKGITFKYNYDFVHAIKALEPNGTYFMSWAQMKPYIKKTGVVAKLAK